MSSTSKYIQYHATNASIQILASKWAQRKDCPDKRQQEGTTLIFVQMSEAAVERAKNHWFSPTFIVETEIAAWLTLYTASEEMNDEEVISAELLETAPGRYFAWVKWFAMLLPDGDESIEDAARHEWNRSRGVK
jgi:hypothetical protein